MGHHAKGKPSPGFDPMDFNRLREILTSRVARPIWWEIAGGHPRALDYGVACRTCDFVRSPGTKRSICQRTFLSALNRARERGRPVQLVCPIRRYAVVLPIVQEEGRCEGYLALCHSEQAFSERNLALAQMGVEAVLRRRRADDELRQLSQTLQPRCVALSTIHTVHRLISSTLQLDDLLPRLARLCCQVVRAQGCVLWLLDRQKQELIPRASVDLTRRKFRPARAYAVGKGAVGRVASTWKAQLTPRTMVVPLVEEECIGILAVRRGARARPFGTLDQEILTTLAEQAVVAIRNAQMYEAQERVTWGTIRSLSAILGGMDTYQAGGTTDPQLLAGTAVAIGRRLGLPTGQLNCLQYAALLHDAGRVGIPSNILGKPTKLEPAEFAKIKEHPVKGASILEPLSVLEPAIPIILHHHERYDGTGYPKGLKKEQIPLGARILAVANAFEAMVTDRPYRKAVAVRSAAREIARHAGTQFDPKVVRAFLRVVRARELDPLLAAAASERQQDGEGRIRLHSGPLPPSAPTLALPRDGKGKEESERQRGIRRRP